MKLSEENIKKVSDEEIVRNYFYRSAVVVRIWMTIALGLYTLFGMLDEYLLPINKYSVWVIRYLIAVPIMAILVLATFLVRDNKKHFQALVILFVAVGMIGLSFMIAQLSPQEKAYHIYFIGLLAGIAWCQIIGLNHKAFTICAVAITILYNCVAIGKQDLLGTDPAVFIFNNLFFLTFTAFGFYSSRITEKFIIDDYYKTIELNHERDLLVKQQKLLSEKDYFKTSLLSVIANEVKTKLPELKNAFRRSMQITMAQETSNKTPEEMPNLVRLNIVMESILMWSELHLNKYNPVKKSVNLRELLDQCAQTMEERADLIKHHDESGKMSLKNQIPIEHNVWGDPQLLRVILNNLISDIIGSARTSQIVARSALQNDKILIMVADDNTKASLLDHMCAEKNMNPSDGRLHFALKVSAELIALSGGNFSMSEENGAVVFWFVLPTPPMEIPRADENKAEKIAS
jgi:signal transduction histidine kinase